MHALDPEASARFLSEILGLPPPRPFGPFMVVELADGVSLDFVTAEPDELIVEHYALRPRAALLDPRRSARAVDVGGLLDDEDADETPRSSKTRSSS